LRDITLPPQLGEAQQRATQASAELSLHQKLRDGDQLRVKELEETILEKGQELQRAQQTVSRLQGQVDEDTGLTGLTVVKCRSFLLKIGF
jgi:hypothetical protein